MRNDENDSSGVVPTPAVPIPHSALRTPHSRGRGATLAGVERALGKAPILRGLSAAQLRRIARKVEVREYPEGATNVAQDHTGRTLYVILQGRVKVVHHGEAGSAAPPPAAVGEGGVFGEMALPGNAPRA